MLFEVKEVRKILDDLYLCMHIRKQSRSPAISKLVDIYNETAISSGKCREDLMHGGRYFIFLLFFSSFFLFPFSLPTTLIFFSTRCCGPHLAVFSRPSDGGN